MVFEKLSAKRVELRVFLPEYVNLGFSKNRIQQELISRFGYAYRRQDLFRDLDYARSRINLSKVGYGDKPGKESFVDRDLNLPHNYRVFADVTLMDDITGEEYTKYVSWYDDSSYSPDQWADRWIADHYKNRYEENVTIIDVNVDFAEHQKGFDW